MQAIGATGVAFIGAEYLLRLFGGGTPAMVPWVAASLLVLLLALNFAGIRSGARTQNVLSVAKIVLIAGLALAAWLWSPDGGARAAISGSTADLGFLGALVAVFYTFGGYQCSMNLAGDVRDGPRRLPRAVLLGMATVTALYLAINVAYVLVLGIEGVASEKLVAAGLARACFGAAGESIVAAAIFLSAAGFVNATILQVPRSYYAMAEDGLLPRAFLRVHPRTQAQDVGLAFMGATALVAVPFLGSFEKLLDYVMFTDSLMVAAVAAGLFVLRRRGVGAPSGFRVPLYPWLPALFVACSLGIAVHIAVTQTALALAGAAVFAAGYPLYRLMRRGR
jgi:APA family basic amino acid/polyamine antiporter